MHPLAIFRVHAIASIYFPDFFLDILPCLIQSQVGQILSHKISYHKLTQFSKKKKYMHYQMTEFCGNFYINPIFKKYFQPVSQPFIQQWSATGSIEKFKIMWS